MTLIIKTLRPIRQEVSKVPFNDVLISDSYKAIDWCWKQLINNIYSHSFESRNSDSTVGLLLLYHHITQTVFHLLKTPLRQNQALDNLTVAEVHFQGATKCNWLASLLICTLTFSYKCKHSMILHSSRILTQRIICQYTCFLYS